MKKNIDICTIVDNACVPDDDPEFHRKPGDDPTVDSYTEYRVVRTLRRLGHAVRVVGVGDDVPALLKSLSNPSPRIVFNLTEQFRGKRRLDQNVAALLEMIQIPFTGAGSTGLVLCRNKGVCKNILSSRKIHVPNHTIYAPGRTVRAPGYLHFPLVVKPLYEDGSDGISNASLVRTADELRERVAVVHSNWKQPAIAEEFIEGRELYAGVLGNRRLTVLPLRELQFGRADEGGPVMATYRVKWDIDYQVKWDIDFVNARVDESLNRVISRIARKVFHLLQMNDYGRIDIRLTPENRVYVLEANPNPGLAPEDEVGLGARKAGISYTELIHRILRTALRRYGISN